MERAIPWILMVVAIGGYFLSNERPNNLVISITLRLIVIFTVIWMIFAGLDWLRRR